jgi:hypothetical protein
MKIILTSATLLLTLVAAPALAAPQIFFDYDDGNGSPLAQFNNAAAVQQDFLNATSSAGLNYGINDLESFPTGSGSINLDFGAAGVLTLNGGDISDSPVAGRFATSGQKFWSTSPGTISLGFSQPVLGFGFYGIDFGDSYGYIEATINYVDGSLATSHDISSPWMMIDGSVLFWGILSDVGIDSITFISTNQNDNDWFALDDIILTGANIPPSGIPEPGALALLGIGLLGGLLRVNGRRHRAA